MKTTALALPNLAATKDRLAALAHEFQHFHDTKHKSYKDLDEAQTRLSYIDKFWRILGWQVDNTSEVLIETRVGTKKPDYRFLLGKETTFFVEAKKPIEKLTNPHHIFQAKSYGWNDSVPMVILMDFEEFRPFRTRTKPHFDEPEKGLIKKYDMLFTDYADRADDLLNTFGREAILGGALKDILKPSAAERNTTVDKEFLKTLADWRERLAAHIAVRNDFRSDVELAEAVQRILDRLVFIRILEDREIEVEPLLEQLTGRGAKDIYTAFVALSRRLQPKYNGLLFNPHPLSETLTLDDNTFRPIVKELLSNESPYRFDVIPVEVLGTIYERFLGDEIRLTDSGRAKIETKPEVRKAGGVYYTPQYIVEYITQNTVGKLLQSCATPADALRLRICDPACGSGSFLLGAFDALIRWHEEWFAAAPNPEKDWYETTASKKNTVRRQLAFREKREDGQNVTQGAVRLTTYAKGRILQSCLYGVDLDRQATEVAQMSLYLKVLEHCAEEERVVGRLLDFKEALLPTLKDNIKCGNSLIGSDFTHDDLFGLSEKEQRKVNPFDWHFHFPFLKQTGGFDAVVGNPPYGAELGSQERVYLEQRYALGNTDTAALFMVQQLSLLKKDGLGGFIVPKPFVYASNWSKTRDRVINELTLIADVSKVWKEVKLEQVIYLIESGKRSDSYISAVRHNELIAEAGVILKSLCTEFGFLLSGVSAEEIRIAQKVREKAIFLGELVSNQRGGMLQKFVQESQSDFEVLGGKQINRYCLSDTVKGYISSQNIDETKAFIKLTSILAQNIVAHIQNPTDHIQIIATISNNTNAVILDTVNQLENQSPYSSYFILGILNSRLINWYVYRFIFAKAIRTMHFDSPVTNRIPYPKLDLSKQSNKTLHDSFALLVQQMLDAQAKLRTAGSDFERGQLQQSIARLDGAIDALVYGLYGLTAEEIRIVEGGN